MSTLEPALRLKRFTVANVTGITVWQPDVEIGGPLVKGRLFTAAVRAVSLPDRRHFEAGPETELKKIEVVQLAHARRRQPLEAPFTRVLEADTRPA